MHGFTPILLEVTFSCPLCSRLFLRDRPYDGPIPRHLDPLLGLPCPGSERDLVSWLEIPEGNGSWAFGVHDLATLDQEQT